MRKGQIELAIIKGLVLGLVVVLGFLMYEVMRWG